MKIEHLVTSFCNLA